MMLGSVKTAFDSYVHFGMPDGRTACGQEGVARPTGVTRIDCPSCTRRLDEIVSTAPVTARPTFARRPGSAS